MFSNSEAVDLTLLRCYTFQGIQRKRSYNSFLFNIIFSLFFKLNHTITYRNNIIQVLKSNTWIIFMNYKKLYFNIIRNSVIDVTIYCHQMNMVKYITSNHVHLVD